MTGSEHVANFDNNLWYEISPLEQRTASLVSGWSDINGSAFLTLPNITQPAQQGSSIP